MIADANAITKSKIEFFWQQSCQPLDPLTPQSTSGPAKSGAKQYSHNQPQEAAPWPLPRLGTFTHPSSVNF
jgi:hypothetical protein